MEKLKFDLLEEDDSDYTVKVTRPDGSFLKVLIPKENGDDPYINKAIASSKSFGLNMVTDGHYL